MYPALCRVPAYSGPGLPSPAETSQRSSGIAGLTSSAGGLTGSAGVASRRSRRLLTSPTGSGTSAVSAASPAISASICADGRRKQARARSACPGRPAG